MCQPLIWNPLFTDEAACVLGLRHRLSWAAMDNGPARTVEDWINFLQTSTQDRKKRLSSLRGANIMVDQLSMDRVSGQSTNFAARSFSKLVRYVFDT